MKQFLMKITEPKAGLPEERKLFSNRDLKILILPLFLEQLLEVLVGVADTFMVSYAGEAAVSGVSLVNMFNTVFIFLFSALAAGGAVAASGDVQILRQDESDALDCYVPAGGSVVGGNRDGLHAP